jgi:hypothetical protein
MPRWQHRRTSCSKVALPDHAMRGSSVDKASAISILYGLVIPLGCMRRSDISLQRHSYRDEYAGSRHRPLSRLKLMALFEVASFSEPNLFDPLLLNSPVLQSRIDVVFARYGGNTPRPEIAFIAHAKQPVIRRITNSAILQS